MNLWLKKGLLLVLYAYIKSTTKVKAALRTGSGLGRPCAAGWPAPVFPADLLAVRGAHAPAALRTPAESCATPGDKRKNNSLFISFFFLVSYDASKAVTDSLKLLTVSCGLRKLSLTAQQEIVRKPDAVRHLSFLKRDPCPTICGINRG